MEAKPNPSKKKKSKSVPPKKESTSTTKNTQNKAAPPCRHFTGSTHHKENQNKRCEALCRRKLKCGHFCSKYCFENCEPCDESYSGGFKGCNHQFSVNCSKREDIPLRCPFEVTTPIVPDCGHTFPIPCKDKNKFRTKSALSKVCPSPCTSTNDFEYGGCGDPCDGVCGSCSNGIFHKRCTQPCGKTLICGHICEVSCSKNCMPCPKPCLTACEHGVCEEPCGVPCHPCKLPCLWECPHKKCTRTCDEVCDREPCTIPCPKILGCGHSCIGFCGEPCSNLCRHCDRDKLIDGFFDGSTTIGDDDRFIYLPDCKHTFEVESLDAWMKVDGDNGEINLKTCPLCRCVIWMCRRYSAILKRKREEHVDLKTRIYGSPNEIRKTQVTMLSDLIKAGKPRGIFDEFRLWLIRRLTFGKDNNDKATLKQMNQVTLNCLEYLSSQWKKAEQKFCRLEREYAEEEFNVIEHYYREIWNFVKTRGIPLTMTEVADMERQFDRIGDLTQLMDRRVNENPLSSLSIQDSPTVAALYYDAYEVLTRRVPYTQEKKQEFLECLLKLDASTKSQLGITENERVMIVRAFGQATGRWFKCVNGHVYVVTECGGPTELGTCNECGTPVGGTDHLAVDGNDLATEMDGATKPLYPTALTQEEELW